MRWNQMKDWNHKKFQMAKDNFEHKPDIAPMKDLKEKLASLKKELTKTKEQKLEEIRLKKAYLNERKIEFMAKDYELYKKQTNAWQKTDIGSCVSLYAKDYINNLSKFWGTSEDQRKKNREEI